MSESFEDRWWSHRLEQAGFGRRAFAALFDALLIVSVLTAYYWFFRNFDDVVRMQMDEVLRAEMPAGTFERTVFKILGLSLIAHLLYGTIMEQFPWSGTFGKWLLGIRVVDEFGERLSLTASAVRNLVKFASAGALGLGFLAVYRNPGRQAWHDRAAGSYVARG